MAGSPVSFNILKGKHAVFIQHTTCQNVYYNMPMSMIAIYRYVFFIFTERLRSSPGGGQGGVSYVICKLNLYLLRKCSKPYFAKAGNNRCDNELE